MMASPRIRFLAESYVTTKGLSLRQKLPLLISTLTAGSLIVAGTLAYLEVRQTATRSAEVRLTSISEDIRELTTGAVESRQEVERAVAASRPMQQALSGRGVDSADLEIALEDLRPSGEESLPLFVLDAEGVPIFSMGALTKPDEFVLEAHPVYGPLFEEGDEIRYWYTSPFPGPDDMPLGWVAQQRALGRGGPALARLFDGVEIHFGAPRDSTWLDLATLQLESAPSTVDFNGPFSFVAPGGEEAIGVAAPMLGTPWIVLVHMPMDMVRKRPNVFLVRITAVGGVLVLAVLFVGWHASEQLTGPLGRLAAAADSMAEGDYGRRIEVKQRDELGRLGRAFNDMAARVADSEAALRSRLEEARTLASQLEGAKVVAENATKDAQAANQAKSAFVAAVSHEIRTPVSVILSYAELLRHNSVRPGLDTQRDSLQRIEESCELLVGLMNDLLDLSSIESGRMRIRHDVRSAHDIVGRVIASQELRAGRKRISLTRKAPHAAHFRGDPQRVQQILLNLVSNALKFTPPGGSVVVTCTLDWDGPPDVRHDGRQGWVRIDVEDSGVGIDPDQIERIFEPFQQADHVPDGTVDGTVEHSGAGLGLAISRGLATMMSGTVTAESMPGVGSLFTLWLPMASPADGDGEEPSPGRRRDAD